MSTAGIKSILSRLNKNYKKLNILTCPTHERYESNLCETGHNFYAIRSEQYQIKKWNSSYAPKPINYHLIDMSEIERIPLDLVLIQQKFGQYQLLKPIANQLMLPSIVLEHTLPHPSWPKQQLIDLKNMRGELNLFISDYSKEAWGWANDEAHTVKHGINIDIFVNKTPIEERNNVSLSVVNDWINRAWCCGFNIWHNATRGLPVTVLGDTQGLSFPAKSTEELVSAYNSSRIFVNTSTVSPIPTALMEAMACGCAVISLNNCMIPEVVKDGYNGILCDSEAELRSAIVTLMQEPKICSILGFNACKTIKDQYNLTKFTLRWNEIFNYAKELRFGT